MLDAESNKAFMEEKKGKIHIGKKSVSNALIFCPWGNNEEVS